MDGGLPSAAPRGVKTQSNSVGMLLTSMSEQGDKELLVAREPVKLISLDQKNARGLVRESRINELMVELMFVEWDIVSINESWRSQGCEFFIVIGGNVFLGSGGLQGKRGVGFIVQKEFLSRIDAFVAITERIAYVDLINDR